MSDFYGGEPVFKKPAVPSRYQRTCSYNRACSEISNASEYSSNKVKEKIEVLERAFPPNDDIWENLVKNIDHLCFVKLSESVLQPNGPRSTINNGNTYPNVLTQRTSSNHGFNSTSSTINTRGFVAQPDLQNVIPIPVPSGPQYRDVRNLEKSEDVNSRNTATGSHYSSRRLLVQNETFQEVRNSRSKSRSSTNSTDNEENDSTLEPQSCTQSTSGLEIIAPPPKKKATATSSKVDKRRSQSAESSNLDRRKRPKKEEAVKATTQRASSVSKTAAKPARQSKSQPQKKSLDLNGLTMEDSNDSLAAFFQKQRKVTVKKPTSVASSAGEPASAKEKQSAARNTRDSQSSQSEEDSQESSSLLSQNTVVKTASVKKSANTRKTKTASNTQQSKAVKSRAKKTQITASREESTSEDESPPVRNGNARKSSKTKATQVKKPAPTRKVRTTQNSSSVEEDSDSDEDHVPVRKKNPKTKDASDVRPRRTVKKMNYGEVSQQSASQDDTPQATKVTRKPVVTKKTNRTKGSPLKKPKLTVARSKATRVSPVKSSAAVPKKKAEVAMQAEESSISTSVNQKDETMGESFFSEVSSIAGNGSVSFLCPEKKRKSKTQPGYDMDGSMHFFSPFTSANLRSTSGFSAVSTPLSKSVAKNVLGKRVKKPSVVAEMRNELKENRKKKRLPKKPNVVQPIQEITATTESECEASDFSD